jgi:hypothetical protein
MENFRLYINLLDETLIVVASHLWEQLETSHIPVINLYEGTQEMCEHRAQQLLEYDGDGERMC